MEGVTIETIRQTLTAGEQREYLDPILADRGEAWVLELTQRSN